MLLTDRVDEAQNESRDHDCRDPGDGGFLLSVRLLLQDICQCRKSVGDIDWPIGHLGIFYDRSVQQPWLGHGFDSVWKVVPTFGPDKFEAAHAHNEILQQFYVYGLAGVCIFVGVYGSLYWQIRSLETGSTKTYLFAFLIFVVVRGMADTDRLDLSLPLWAVVLLSGLARRYSVRAGPLVDQLRRMAGSATPYLRPIVQCQMKADRLSPRMTGRWN